jgi:hypothetical protein
LDYDSGTVSVKKIVITSNLPDAVAEASINIIPLSVDRHILILYGGASELSVSSKLFVFRDYSWFEIALNKKLPLKGHSSVLKNISQNSWSIVYIGGKGESDYFNGIAELRLNVNGSNIKIEFNTDIVLAGEFRREGHRSVLIDGGIYVYGGCNYKNKICFEDEISIFKQVGDKIFGISLLAIENRDMNLKPRVSSVFDFRGQIGVINECTDCNKFGIVIRSIESNCLQPRVVKNSYYEIFCHDDVQKTALDNVQLDSSSEIKIMSQLFNNQTQTFIANEFGHKNYSNNEITDTISSKPQFSNNTTINEINNSTIIENDQTDNKTINDLSKINNETVIGLINEVRSNISNYDQISETLSRAKENTTLQNKKRNSNKIKEIKEIVEDVIKTTLSNQTSDFDAIMRHEKEADIKQNDLLQNLTELKGAIVDTRKQSTEVIQDLNAIKSMLENIKDEKSRRVKETAATLNCINGYYNEKR